MNATVEIINLDDEQQILEGDPAYEKWLDEMLASEEFRYDQDCQEVPPLCA